MSDKNLLIGDTTYPHLAASTNENICAQLRKLAPDLVEHHTKQIVFAADRIEQLERELIEAKKGHARYEYVRKLNAHQFQKIFTMNLTSAVRFDNFIDAAIKKPK